MPAYFKKPQADQVQVIMRYYIPDALGEARIRQKAATRWIWKFCDPVLGSQLQLRRAPSAADIEMFLAVENPRLFG